MPVAESITLFFKQGTSDKQYHAELINDGPPLASLAGSWKVRFAYGRRGATVQTGFKVQNVSEGLARQEFCRLLEAKLQKGYQVEVVTVRGPSINAILPRYWQGAGRGFAQAAEAIVRTSTPRTPRQGAPVVNLDPVVDRLAAALGLRQGSTVRVQPPARFQKPPAPKPAPATVDPFAPVKRKIKLS